MPPEEASPGAMTTQPGTGTTRGIGWASNIGWGVAVLGLLIIFYSYYYGVTEGANYNPGGISGTKLGAGLFLIGLIAGAVFLFVPMVRPSKFDPAAGADDWKLHVDASQYMEKASRIIAWVGVGIVMVGLLLAIYVYDNYRRASSDQDTFNLLGRDLGWSTWSGVFLMLSVVGGFLWAVFWVRADSYRYAGQGYAAAHHHALRSGGGSPGAPPMTAPSSGAPGGAGMPAGVSPEQLSALMKRLDAMLATLPEDQVASFSRSPEAETYLKLLSQKGPRPETP